MSGCTPCACRDCMDVAMSSDIANPELCGLCEEAGCEPLPMTPFPGMLTMFNCQREDAYEDDVADAGTGHGAYEYRSGA